MQTLYRSDNLLVRYLPCEDSARLVVAFDCYSNKRDLDRDGFGQSYFQGRGIGAIHVLGRDNDWYQYSDLPDALSAVADVTRRATQVITYGSSMGAYAAIRFADAVGAARVLAISPQYSIDPAKAPFEHRWRIDARRIRFLDHLDGPIRCTARVVVAHDPHDRIDQQQLDLITRELPVTTIPVVYGAHSVATLLSETSLLTPLIDAVLEDHVDRDWFRRRLRQRRADTATYWMELSKRQPPHRPRLAMALAKKAVALKPEFDVALEVLANRFAAEGEPAQAIEIYERLLASSNREYHYLPTFRRVLWKAGYHAQAIAIGREMIERRPGVSQLHSRLAGMALAAGDPVEAITHAGKAARLEPRSPLFRLAMWRLIARARWRLIRDLALGKPG